MASSARFATPPRAFSAREPVTPEGTGLRNRGTTQTPTPGADASPTSSTISNFSIRVEPSRSLYRSIPSAPPSALSTPARKVTIRADPAILTCFDPSDKELYDLWVPKS